MPRILKFEIPPQAKFYIKLPVQSRVLTAQLQADRPVMWVLDYTAVNSTSSEQVPFHIRKFLYAWTGDDLGVPEKNLRFISTIQHRTGMVYHLFELLEDFELPGDDDAEKKATP